MLDIARFSGEQLLAKETISAIEREVAVLLQKKDVALAWQWAMHIKKELTALPADKVSPVLPLYRTITTRLKVLALPLLEEADIQNLLKNNSELIPDSDAEVFADSIGAWLASVSPNEKKAASAIIQTTLANKKNSAARMALARIASTPPIAPTEQLPEIKKPVLTPVLAFALGQTPRTDALLDADELYDLQAHAQTTGTVKSVNSAGASKLADQLYMQSGSTEDKQRYIERTQKLLESRMRDIRTELELQQYFSRPFVVGGLGLSGAVLETALAETRALYAGVHSASVPTIPAPTPVEPLRIVPIVEPKPAVSVPQKPTQQKPVLRTITPEAQKEIDILIGASAGADPRDLLSSLVKKQTAIQQNAQQTPQQPSTTVPVLVNQKRVEPTQQPAVSVAPKAQTTPLTQPRTVRKSQVPEASAGKMHVADVLRAPQAYARQVVGLADELRLMTLVEYRRLGEASEASESLAHKINVLGTDSYGARIHGIREFWQSPLYKQYMAIGEASIDGEQKLSEVLANTTLNPDAMTEDEFFSITALNGKLRI